MHQIARMEGAAMKRLALLLKVVGLSLAVNGLAYGQSRPDFSGEWQMDMSRSGSVAQRADASPTTPVRVTIEQTPSHIRIETYRDGERQNLRFVFGETDGAFQPAGTSGSDELTVQPVHVQWKGEELVTTAVYRVNRMAVKQIQTRRLAEGGREMIVETLLEMQHGYETNHPEYKAGTTVSDVFSRVQ
jgi:hypothetical protein